MDIKKLTPMVRTLRARKATMRSTCMIKATPSWPPPDTIASEEEEVSEETISSGVAAHNLHNCLSEEDRIFFLFETDQESGGDNWWVVLAGFCSLGLKLGRERYGVVVADIAVPPRSYLLFTSLLFSS